MTKTKHTQGPWIYKKESNCHEWWIAQKGSQAAKKNEHDINVQGGVVGCSEWLWLKEDDALLITCAPELLEALEWALDNGNFNDLNPDSQEAVKGIEQLIKRAKGDL